MITDHTTNSVGTQDWLQATAHLNIKAYTEVDETPLSQNTEVYSSGDSAIVSARVTPTEPWFGSHIRQSARAIRNLVQRDEA
jgi:hypothetical protein